MMVYLSLIHIFYTRYMDDIVIIAPSKEIAREWLAKIKEFLRARLHLDTNKKTKVFYMRQGVNAYGFKIKATPVSYTHLDVYKRQARDGLGPRCPTLPQNQCEAP